MQTDILTKDHGGIIPGITASGDTFRTQAKIQVRKVAININPMTLRGWGRGGGSIMAQIVMKVIRPPKMHVHAQYAYGSNYSLNPTSAFMPLISYNKILIFVTDIYAH